MLETQSSYTPTVKEIQTNMAMPTKFDKTYHSNIRSERADSHTKKEAD